MTVILNGRKVVDIEVDGADSNDYPDFCDAYFSYAVYEGSGVELTDEELEQLADEYPGMLNELAYESFH
jgi:hypothetical protein